MDKKTCLWLMILAGLACCCAEAQTNVGTSRSGWVTNWVDVPVRFRVAQGRVYNVLMPPWQWLVLSNSFQEAGDDGVVHPITNIAIQRRMTIATAVTNAGRDELQVTVFHYPFNPTNFVVGTNGEVRASKPVWMRVLPFFAETNSVDGREVDSLMYDFGMPCTNKLPVRKYVVAE